MKTECNDLLGDDFELIFCYEVAERFGYCHATNMIENIIDKSLLIPAFEFLHDIEGLNYKRVEWSVSDEIAGDHDIFETEEQAQYYKEKTINEYCAQFTNPANAHEARKSCEAFYKVNKITQHFINGNLDHIQCEPQP